jgi:putative ABC transport system permease protein
MLNDLRFAIRMLAKAPGFTAVAIATLAIGIGASTSIFSGLNALLLRPLPVETPSQLVSGYAIRDGVDPYTTSLLEYLAYRERSRSFSNSGIGSQRAFNLIASGEPRQLRGAAVTADYFITLGVQPLAGRLFRPEEDDPNSTPVAAVSYEVWQQLFGGDPAIIGRAVRFEEGSYTVVGILPPGFNLPFAADVWVPLQLNFETVPLEQRAQNRYDFVARLRPGVSLREADVELKGIARSLEKEYPQFRRGWSYKLISLRQNLIGDLEGRTRKALFALVAAVALVLVICCANLANLLLASGIARGRELSIRFALGASRSRIVRQLLTESLVLAFVGGALGLILAYWTAPLLGVLSPIQAVSFASFLRDFRIDVHVLVFALLVSILTAPIVGLIPAFKAIRSHDLVSGIKQGEQHLGGSAFAGRRLLNLIVVAEIALAAALLVPGALVVQSFQALQRVKLGFRPENLSIIELALSSNRYHEHSQRVSFADQVLQRVKALPGVVSASTTTNYPLQLFDSASSYTVEGQPPSPSSSAPTTIHRLVSHDYFQALGATLLKGRAVNEQDTARSLPVVVVNREFARQAWPGEDAIGKRVRRGGPNETGFPWMTVVGVVENIKEDRFNFKTDRPVWYAPYAQQESSNPLQLIVRTSKRQSDLLVAVRSGIYSIDPNQPISATTSMTSYLIDVLMPQRFSAILMGTLAAIGLLLAGIGLYGVMSYSVSRRTGELGLRIALGAGSRHVFQLVLGQGFRLVAAGLITGFLGAYALTRGFSAILYQINPTDHFTFLGVTLLLLAVALIACCVPARRATRVDPIVALRTE